MKRVLLLIPIAALCAWGVVVWSYEPLLCNQELNSMRARTSATGETVNDYRLALAVRDNLTRLRRLEGPCRTNPRVYMLEAQNQYLLGQKEASIEAIRRALAVDQRPEFYAAIGETLFELGRVDEAVDNYVIAARFNALVLDQIEAEQVKRKVLERMHRPAP